MPINLRKCQCNSRILQDRIAGDGGNTGTCWRSNAYSDTDRHGYADCNCYRYRHGYVNYDTETYSIPTGQSSAEAASNSPIPALALAIALNKRVRRLLELFFGLYRKHQQK